MKTFRQYIKENGNMSGTGAVTGLGYDLGINVADLISVANGIEHEDELLWPMFRRYNVVESFEHNGIDDATDAVEMGREGPTGNPGETDEDEAILDKFQDQQAPIWPMVQVKKKKKKTNEDIGNTAGSGAIAGIGVGPQGEPGIVVSGDDELSSASFSAKKAVWPMTKRKDSKISEDLFAGSEVFDVSADVFHKCRLGKLRYHRWSKYVGDDDMGQKIRDYGQQNPSASIVIRNAQTGAMMFLRHSALPSFVDFCS